MGDQIIARRFEHQTLRCRHCAQPLQILARHDADVGVRQQPPLQGSLAGPDDIGREVFVAKLFELRGDAFNGLWPLAGKDQQLLRVAPHRLLDEAIYFVRRVQVRLVRLEGAVLAVALAAARKREREVAGECDSAAHCQLSLCAREKLRG